MISERGARVRAAWAKAHGECAGAVAVFVAKHPCDGACIDTVRAYSATLANGIEQAEKEAEAASVAWLDGGPGGVQVKIDRWVELWREALEVVALAR